MLTQAEWKQIASDFGRALYVFRLGESGRSAAYPHMVSRCKASKIAARLAAIRPGTVGWTVDCFGDVVEGVSFECPQLKG